MKYSDFLVAKCTSNKDHQTQCFCYFSKEEVEKELCPECSSKMEIVEQKDWTASDYSEIICTAILENDSIFKTGIPKKLLEYLDNHNFDEKTKIDIMRYFGSLYIEDEELNSTSND
jgi:hypothetical protein